MLLVNAAEKGRIERYALFVCVQQRIVQWAVAQKLARIGCLPPSGGDPPC